MDVSEVQRDGRSWYSRLAPLAFKLVSQWILIHLGFTSPGGHKVEVNSTACRTLLMHVPTGPIDDDGGVPQFPPFPIACQSLEEWLEIANSPSPSPRASSSPSPCSLKHTTERATEVAKTVDASEFLLTGSYSLSHPTLISTLRDSEKQNHKATEAIQPTMDKLAVPSLSVSDLWDPARAPPAKIYQSELSPTDYTFINSNTVTKIDIALQLAYQEKSDWETLIGTCQAQVDRYQTSINEFEHLKTSLRVIRDRGKQAVMQVRESQRRADRLEEEINHESQNPLIRGVLEAERKQYLDRSPFSPAVSSTSRIIPPAPCFVPSSER